MRRQSPLDTLAPAPGTAKRGAVRGRRDAVEHDGARRRPTHLSVRPCPLFCAVPGPSGGLSLRGLPSRVRRHSYGSAVQARHFGAAQKRALVGASRWRTGIAHGIQGRCKDCIATGVSRRFAFKQTVREEKGQRYVLHLLPTPILPLTMVSAQSANPVRAPLPAGQFLFTS